MLISKTPLRISFLGGGTDFPWYFEEHGGAVISAAINQHIYISCLRSFNQKTYYLKYSNYEVTENVASIKHPIFREALLRYNTYPLDVSVMAEIPAGNGLASSSAFTVGLVNLLSATAGERLDSNELALKAIELELDVLQEPIGVQDQLGSSYGGLNYHHFSTGRKIESEALAKNDKKFPFEMQLVKVGVLTRSASDYTLRQRDYVQQNPEVLNKLHRLRDLTYQARKDLSTSLDLLPDYVNEGWRLKAESNPNVLNAEISHVQDVLNRGGALASKLLGAGGGGFVLAIFEPGESRKSIEAFEAENRTVIPVSLDYDGPQIMEI